MWAYQLDAPQTLICVPAELPTAANLRPGDLLLDFLAGGICGSDIPKFAGRFDPDTPTTGQIGVPLHELVARVFASRDPRFTEGDRIVCHVPGAYGLQERLIVPGEYAHRLSDTLSDVAATMVQPLSTVLSSLARARPLEGLTVAVIGLGPLGLLFTHVAHSRGARVIGVDRVSRHGVAAEAFGIDEVVHSESRAWATSMATSTSRPDVVIDAVGHSQDVLADAVEVVAENGQILVFGLPEDHYVLPMRRFFRKGLNLSAGVNKEWDRYLTESEDYVLAHPSFPGDYISAVFPHEQAQKAFELYSKPAPDRFKVVIAG